MNKNADKISYCTEIGQESDRAKQPTMGPLVIRRWVLLELEHSQETWGDIKAATSALAETLIIRYECWRSKQEQNMALIKH